MGWLLDLLAKLLGVFLEPRNDSATSEAERAGAAEQELRRRDADDAAVKAAADARDRASRIRPDPGGGMPDDGFRRD